MFLQLFYSVINRFEFQYGKRIAKEKTKFDIKDIFSLKNCFCIRIRVGTIKEKVIKQFN